MSFFVIFASVLFIGCTYIALRLIPRTSLRGWKRILAYVFCYLPMLNMPLRHTVRDMSRQGLPIAPWMDEVLFCSYVLIGSLSVVATVVFTFDIFLIGKWLYKKFSSASKKSTQPSSPAPSAVNTSRRVFMQNSISAGLMAASGGLVAYGANEALFVPEVKHIRVPIENLPQEFHGYTFAQITDLHINRPVPPSRMEGIVEKIHALQPDAIAITGDLSDSFPHQVQAEFFPLSTLRAPDGVYFVNGNHEYYTNIGQWTRQVRKLGIDELINEHRVIQRGQKRLLICGVPDIQMSHKSSPALAQRGSLEGDIKVLLSHQPQNIYDAADLGYHLHMCGHTHGGQLFPWTYVTDWVQPYIHGLYTVKNTKLYVNRGAGFWGPPLRIGAPPEIALLELISA